MKKLELRQIIREEISRVIKENPQPNSYVSMLEDELGTKVTISYYSTNDDKFTVYPNSKPNSQFYDERNAQRIDLEVKDGKFSFSGAFGYDKSIIPMAQLMGQKPKETNIAGMSVIDAGLSGSKPEVNINQIKKLVTIMQKGLKDEAQAQANFYKNRTPD